MDVLSSQSRLLELTVGPTISSSGRFEGPSNYASSTIFFCILLLLILLFVQYYILYLTFFVFCVNRLCFSAITISQYHADTMSINPKQLVYEDDVS